tara:strand:+ start:293 stop:862 length:570 start_codon:yes stop_codon:yes gene_type:complete
MILLIDNYDSFTYNIYQYVREFSSNVCVKKNDECTIDHILKTKYSHIIISPGPGSPSDAGISSEIIKTFYKQIPIFGICLGHQVIGDCFGLQVKNHSSICHGKVSTIVQCQNSLLYDQIPKKFQATRYHSLVIDADLGGSNLKANARLEDGTIMGVEHQKYNLFGVQFHPESIETVYGKKIIENFINIV